MKRNMVFLLSLLMITVLMFTGCASTSGTTTATPTPTTTATSTDLTVNSTQQDSTKETETQKEPSIIKMMTQDAWNQEVSITVDTPIQKELEKLANVKIEWETATPGDNFDTLVRTRFASGSDIPDIVFSGAFSNTEAINLVKNGIIIPLEELIDKVAPNIKKIYYETKPNALKYTKASDGHLYWIGYFDGDAMTNVQSCPTIRKDWLDAVGITKIPETTDEFYNAIKTMYEKDPNGNKKKDEVIIGGCIRDISDAFGVKNLTSSSQRSFYEDENGQIKNAWTADETKEYISYISKIFKEGLIDPEAFTMSSSETKAKLLQNKCSATFEDGLYKAGMMNKDCDKNGLKGAYYVSTLPLKGPQGQQGVLANMDLPQGKCFITKNCKDPEAAMRFLDVCMSPEGFNMLKYGVENIDWTMGTDGNPVITEKFKENMEADKNYLQKQGGCLYSSLPKVCPDTNADQTVDSWQTWQLEYTPEREWVKKIAEASEKCKYYGFQEGVATEEEQQEIDSASKELWTYMDEMAVKFVMGKEPLENWDKYVVKCNELGLDKAIGAYQKMNDRMKK